MKGLFHTAVAAVITLALITFPASSVNAAWQTGSPTLFDVMNVVYCVIGAGACEGLEPGADLVDITTDNQASYDNGFIAGAASVTPEDGITQATVDAAVAAVDITSDNQASYDAGVASVDVAAAVAAAMPDCDFDGGQVWDGSTCATPECEDIGATCFLMGLCGLQGAKLYGVLGPYSQMSQADAVALGPGCIAGYAAGQDHLNSCIHWPTNSFICNECD